MPQRCGVEGNCICTWCPDVCSIKAGLAVGLIIPDLWQQEAVRALQQGKDVVVQAPTGSGKTYIFELLYPNLKTQAVFTVPTRALVLQFASLSLNNGSVAPAHNSSRFNHAS